MRRKHDEPDKGGRPRQFEDYPVDTNHNIAMPELIYEMTDTTRKALDMSRSAFVRHFYLRGLQMEIQKGDNAFLELATDGPINPGEVHKAWKRLQAKTRGQLKELGLISADE